MINTQNLVAELIEQKVCLAIMGPTASGKSSLSMALAEQLNMEIISVDSALVYQKMDIGTAKPSEAEMAQVPHHLINIIDPTETYSAAEFIADVHCLVAEIFARGRLPVLVGGTMMYFNALQKGMAKLPSADAGIRNRLQKEWEASSEEVHARLAEVDPDAAKRIHQNDPQRIIRALEVYELTGQSITSLQQAAAADTLKDFSLCKVALIPNSREALHQQIIKRFKQMVALDFLAEVKGLMEDERLHIDLTSIRSVGYRQAWEHLEGDSDFDTFLEKCIVATRQLAKRQITWLRKETELTTIDPFETSLEDQVEQVLALLKTCVNK